MNSRLLISTLLCFTAATAWPQDEPVEAQPAAGAPQPSFPCKDREDFDQFDFWLGHWDVHTADGKSAGRNRIEKADGGCVLIEKWVGRSGSTGTSMNFVDITTGEWVQVWSGAGGTQIDIRGGLTDDGMLLEGEIHYVGNGTSAPFRGLWTPLPDGRVRQFFEQFDADTESWAPWFEGFYTRSNANQDESE